MRAEHVHALVNPMSKPIQANDNVDFESSSAQAA